VKQRSPGGSDAEASWPCGEQHGGCVAVVFGSAWPRHVTNRHLLIVQSNDTRPQSTRGSDGMPADRPIFPAAVNRPATVTNHKAGLAAAAEKKEPRQIVCRGPSCCSARRAPLEGSARRKCVTDQFACNRQSRMAAWRPVHSPAITLAMLAAMRRAGSALPAALPPLGGLIGRPI
jgi:hypothetical protein